MCAHNGRKRYEKEQCGNEASRCTSKFISERSVTKIYNKIIDQRVKAYTGGLLDAVDLCNSLEIGLEVGHEPIRQPLNTLTILDLLRVLFSW